jgi:transcriptional regulator
MKTYNRAESEENTERVYRLRKRGFTFDEIGEMVGMSGDRVFFVLKRRAMRKKKKASYRGL